MLSSGSDAFVGRERELAQLGAALEGAHDGPGRALEKRAPPKSSNRSPWILASPHSGAVARRKEPHRLTGHGYKP